MKHPHRHWAWMVIVAGAVAMGGCARPRGELLVPPETPIVWPKPPDVARVRYLGEFRSSADLNAGKTAGQVWNEILYGPEAPSPLVTPHAVAVSADGNRVAVADTDLACVHVFELDTRAYRRIEDEGDPGRRLECPTGVAWDGERLWVTDSRLRTAVVFDSAGRGRRVGEGVLQRPAGVAFCPLAGRAYVADSAGHAIVAFDREGNEVLRFGRQGGGPGEFNFPAQVAVGPDGTLVVADTMNFRVQRFDREGRFLNTFGQKGDATGDMALPKGVAVGPDGNIWVVDAHFENVQAFTPEGRLLMVFGEEGHDPGEFWLPAGICIDAKRRMWIADSYNRRVQVFELLP